MSTSTLLQRFFHSSPKTFVPETGCSAMLAAAASASSSVYLGLLYVEYGLSTLMKTNQYVLSGWADIKKE